MLRGPTALVVNARVLQVPALVLHSPGSVDEIDDAEPNHDEPPPPQPPPPPPSPPSPLVTQQPLVAGLDFTTVLCIQARARGWLTRARLAAGLATSTGRLEQEAMALELMLSGESQGLAN